MARRLLAIALSLSLLSVGYVAGSRHVLTPAYVIGADDCATFACQYCRKRPQICLPVWANVAQSSAPMT